MPKKMNCVSKTRNKDGRGEVLRCAYVLPSCTVTFSSVRLWNVSLRDTVARFSLREEFRMKKET